MVLRSEIFNDVYFSADDGMAETHHVFLDGNDLPHAWVGRDEFTIAETGFGTGLNFLCAWKLFEETSASNQRLNFISIEKYPLSSDVIRKTLSPWRGELGEYIDKYLSLYPIRVPGGHHIYINNRVTLTVWFGDVVDTLPEWSGCVDAWFLDGFTPSKNPDMWSDDLFQNMARLSHEKTTFATFTAAGFVKRGLEAAGFAVQKTKGFGRKRDMMIGRFINSKPKQFKDDIQSIAIIGGGLAGCAMAYMAHRYGVKVSIYEAGDKLASGASGGQLGMINPKLTAKPTPQSDYYTAAFANALRLLSGIGDVNFNIHGSRHICVDEDKDRRFTGYIENLRWHADHIKREGKDIFYPDGASVCPEKLCHALAKNADIKLNHKIESKGDVDTDIIILANGHAVRNLMGDDLPVNWVRGQVSWVKPQTNVTQNISYGGYITPETDGGFHVLGSTLDPKNETIELRNEDHAEVLCRYNNRMGEKLTMDDIVGGWSALRTSSRDRFPVVGRVDDKTYISTAHGSHGIISSLYAAQIIMAQIIDGHVPASQSVLKSLSPQRFHKKVK